MNVSWCTVNSSQEYLSSLGICLTIKRYNVVHVLLTWDMW